MNYYYQLYGPRRLFPVCQIVCSMVVFLNIACVVLEGGFYCCQLTYNTTLCSSVVGGYQHFRGTHCLCLQDTSDPSWERLGLDWRSGPFFQLGSLNSEEGRSMSPQNSVHLSDDLDHIPVCKLPWSGYVGIVVLTMVSSFWSLGICYCVVQ
jgi:hypothetical protein